jgi:hypothetical protein
MNTKDLLKEAIADAKAVRETALAQAKLALEEAFMPRLTSMFNARLQETMDDMEDKADKMYEAEDEMVDKAKVEVAKEKMEEMADMESYDDDDNSIAEIDLDEILAELDAELNEAKEAEDEEEIEAEEDVEDVEADEEESDEEEKEVSELSMDELEAMIRDIVSQEMGPDGEEDMDVDASVDMDAELPDTADDEVNLDEILAELLDEETTLTEGKKRSKYGGNKGDVPASKRGDKKDTAEEEGVEDYKKKKKKELSEIMTGAEFEILKMFGDNAAILGPLTSILAAAGIAKGPEIANALAKAKDKVKAALAKKSDDSSKLDEAMETVEILRNELNEVNLLNAKLLYVNKIFKAKNLTEAQKIKVVQAFDKAESAKEAKLVYESLNETFTAKAGRNQIKESLGFASKAAGVAPQKQAIVESNEFISRMQKLANIK